MWQKVSHCSSLTFTNIPLFLPAPIHSRFFPRRHSVRLVGSLARSRLRQCPVHSPQFPQPANPSQPSSTLPFPSLPRLTSLPRFAPTVPRKAADHGMTISLPFLSLPSFFLWAKPCLQVVLMRSLSFYRRGKSSVPVVMTMIPSFIFCLSGLKLLICLVSEHASP